MTNTITVPGLVGQKITAVRAMTTAEMESLGWHEDLHGAPTVIETEQGNLIIPSRDPELNGNGHLLGRIKTGEYYDILVE